MGNSDSHIQENNHNLLFEESKKEYFSHFRKNMKNNIKEIVSTLGRSKSTLNNNESDDNNAWQSFLISKLKIYRMRMNQNTTIYVDNVINYVDKLVDTNDNQVHKLKVFLSNEIDETRNIRKFSSSSKEEKKENNESFSPSKNEIILRSIDFIFHNLDNIDHPLNKVIKLINFNFSSKYQKELNELERMEENNNNLERPEKFNSSPIKSRKNTSKSSNFEKNKNKDLKSNPIKIPIEEMNKFYLYIKDEISNLSFILILTIIKFYNIIEEPEYRIIDIIEEKVKDLLVSGDILKFLQRLKYNSKRDIIEKYQEKFLEYYNILPRDLAISPYFSFDTDFQSKIKEMLGRNTEILVPIESNTSILPFCKSLIYFREINRTDSIIQKLEIMYNLRDVILSEIDVFWHGFPIQQKKRYVDADNLLSIFIYLVIKSQLADLIIDIEIIDDFINKSLKLSRKGYFFSLVQSSFEYLLNTMSNSQLEININEYKYTLDKELSSLENKTESIIDMSLIKKEC